MCARWPGTAAVSRGGRPTASAAPGLEKSTAGTPGKAGPPPPPVSGDLTSEIWSSAGGFTRTTMVGGLVVPPRNRAPPYGWSARARVVHVGGGEGLQFVARIYRGAPRRRDPKRRFETSGDGASDVASLPSSFLFPFLVLIGRVTCGGRRRVPAGAEGRGDKSPVGRVLFISDKFSVDGFLRRLE